MILYTLVMLFSSAVICKNLAKVRYARLFWRKNVWMLAYIFCTKKVILKSVMFRSHTWDVCTYLEMYGKRRLKATQWFHMDLS